LCYIRYESPYWRSLAATRIQVAWRYRKKRLSRINSSPSDWTLRFWVALLYLISWSFYDLQPNIVVSLGCYHMQGFHFSLEQQNCKLISPPSLLCIHSIHCILKKRNVLVTSPIRGVCNYCDFFMTATTVRIERWLVMLSVTYYQLVKKM